MAGFEVAIHGRFWGGHRGSNDSTIRAVSLERDKRSRANLPNRSNAIGAQVSLVGRNLFHFETFIRVLDECRKQGHVGGMLLTNLNRRHDIRFNSNAKCEP